MLTTFRLESGSRKLKALSEKRDSNPRPDQQGRALPTELFSHTTTGLLLFIQDIKSMPDKIYNVLFFVERKNRDSNPQPLQGHIFTI